MEREIDLGQVSDGKLYAANDLVKVGCSDCAGCSACCRNMGTSIILDPYDIWQLQAGLGKGFAELMAEGRIELNMQDGLILPNLKLAGEGESCTFLNAEGRCSIHSFRPGFCRLFPLGRIYEENGEFHYFLQIHECRKENRTKVRVKKWIGVADWNRYEQFVKDWHAFLKEQRELAHRYAGEKEMKELNLSLLGRFYVEPYDGKADFYGQFYSKIT